MKKLFICIGIIGLLGSCSSTPDVEENNVIHLKEALNHPVEMNLSEVVDSLVYIPLETTPDCYVKDCYLLTYSSPFWVHFYGTLFDSQGKFAGKVGTMGQGPGEEGNGWGYQTFYDEDKELYYTKGDKLIQFDKDFHFTGKEKRLTLRLDNGNVSSGLRSPYAFVRAGKYNALINYPDSIYWIDENLNTVKQERIIPDSLFLSTPGGGFMVEYTLSVYNDTTLFFNCFTDELCFITENSVQTRWKLDLEGEKADSRCFLNGLQKLYVNEMRNIIKSTKGNKEAMKRQAANSTLAKLVDGKKWIGSAYESDRYVIFTWSNLLAFQDWRGGNKSYWAFYDKQTRTVKAVSNLKNDLDGFTDIKSRMGIQNGVIMSAFWPYDAERFIERQKAEGKPVNPKLEKAVADCAAEANPIIVLGYLKK